VTTVLSPTSWPTFPRLGRRPGRVAGFRVDDVPTTVRTLRSRGVTFLGADDLPFTLDEDGVSSDTPGMQVAWMRDPDGSVLTVFSTAPSSPRVP
jgi:hypothetical protein